MEKLKFIVALLLVSSCAYKPARIIEHLPDQPNQHAQQKTSDIIVKVLDYEDMNELQPRYVRRKLRNKEITLLPVYIKNQTLDTFIFNYNHLELFVDYEKVNKVSTKKTHKALKQHQVKTLPWHIISAWFITGYILTDMSLTNTIKNNPWPLVTLPMGIYNCVKIRSSNRSLRKELNATMINTMVLGPGAELTVIVAVNALISDGQQVDARLITNP